MYKSGKNWVFAGVIGLTMGTGAILTTNTEASADEKKHASTLEDDEDAPRNSKEVRLDASETKASSVSEETKLISDAQNSEEAVVAETFTEATTEVETADKKSELADTTDVKSDDNKTETQATDAITQPEAK